jgi:hypothetical protein
MTDFDNMQQVHDATMRITYGAIGMDCKSEGLERRVDTMLNNASEIILKHWNGGHKYSPDDPFNDWKIIDDINNVCREQLASDQSQDSIQKICSMYETYILLTYQRKLFVDNDAGKIVIMDILLPTNVVCLLSLFPIIQHGKLYELYARTQKIGKIEFIKSKKYTFGKVDNSSVSLRVGDIVQGEIFGETAKYQYLVETSIQKD